MTQNVCAKDFRTSSARVSHNERRTDRVCSPLCAPQCMSLRHNGRLRATMNEFAPQCTSARHNVRVRPLHQRAALWWLREREPYFATDYTDYTDSVTCILRRGLVTGLKGRVSPCSSVKSVITFGSPFPVQTRSPLRRVKLWGLAPPEAVVSGRGLKSIGAYESSTRVSRWKSGG